MLLCYHLNNQSVLRAVELVFAITISSVKRINASIYIDVPRRSRRLSDSLGH